MSIHAAAQSGFDADAARYARGRPDYPAEVTDWLRDSVDLEPGRTVVDLGAGTGKFTRRLLATGARVIAVEPVAGMRAKLSADLPEVEVLEGSAASIPLADSSVDAIVCAQAFHWFATLEALAELRRVLKPGGVLGLIWNTKDVSVPWVKSAFAVIEPYEGDVPRFNSGAWRTVFPADGFGPLREEHFRHEHRGGPETVIVDRLLSVSFISSLPDSERETVATKLRNLIATDPALSGKTEIAVPYTTFAFTTEKL
jgi:SAM-dependent methyltransferase